MVRRISDVNINLQRFWRRVEKTESCWNWTGATDRYGYGTLTHVLDGKRRDISPHRVSYMLLCGEIPDGAIIDHRCHNKVCVNPGHLRPVNRKQNNENRLGSQVNSKTGVRGVVWHESSRKWTVHVQHQRKAKYVGSFSSIEAAQEAAIAYRNSVFTHNDLDRKQAAI